MDVAGIPINVSSVFTLDNDPEVVSTVSACEVKYSCEEACAFVNDSRA